VIRYIGDIHGRDDLYAKALVGCDASVQVGDFGFGFVPPHHMARWPGRNVQHRMIRGNHDDPAQAEAHPGFIDSGYEADGTFYVNGGLSIDRDWRIEGVSWWPDEQHSVEDLQVLIDIYAMHRPRRVVSHEGPVSAIVELFRPDPFTPSRTSRALDAMLRVHRPEQWIFGHWHKNRDQIISGTRFICLKEGGWIDLPDMTP
jgi:predicted phosphohydrolase